MALGLNGALGRVGAIIWPIAALLASTALMVTGNGMQMLVLPLRAQAEHFPPLMIGLLGTGYFLGFTVGCLAGPRLIAAVGHIRTYAALVSLTVVVVLALSLLVTPVTWVAGRFVTGLCVAGLSLVLESWLHDQATPATRGVVMSSYVAINLTVITVGQLLAARFDPAGFTLFALMAILLSLAALPVTLTRATQPAPLLAVRLRPRFLYALSPAGFVSIFGIGLANGAFWGLAPVVVQTASGSMTFVASFMSAAVLGGALVQAPLGQLSDRLDRRRIAQMLSLLSAALALLVALVLGLGQSGAGALLLAMLFGAVTLPGYAVIAAHVFDLASRDDMVEVSAGLLLTNALGAAAGPLLASALMTAMGNLWGFALFTAVAQLAVFTYLRHRLAITPSPAPTDKAQFDFSATAPVLSGPVDEARGEAGEAPGDPGQADSPAA